MLAHLCLDSDDTLALALLVPYSGVGTTDAGRLDTRDRDLTTNRPFSSLNFLSSSFPSSLPLVLSSLFRAYSMDHRTHLATLPLLDNAAAPNTDDPAQSRVRGVSSTQIGAFQEEALSPKASFCWYLMHRLPQTAKELSPTNDQIQTLSQVFNFALPSFSIVYICFQSTTTTTACSYDVTDSANAA